MLLTRKKTAIAAALLVLTALLAFTACASAPPSAESPAAVTVDGKVVALGMKRDEIRKLLDEGMGMDLEGGFLMCDYSNTEHEFVVLYDPKEKAGRLRCFGGVTAYNGLTKGMSRDEALAKCPEWAVDESAELTRVDFGRGGGKPGEVEHSLLIHFEGGAVKYFVLEYPGI